MRESVGFADLSWMVKFDLKGKGLKSLSALGEGVFSWVLGQLHCLVTCDPSAQDKLRERLQGLGRVDSDLALPPPVYVTDVTSVYSHLLLAGPRCRQVLAKLTSLNLSERSLPNLSCGQASLAHVRAVVLRKDLDSLPAYHLLVSREYGESVEDSVLHAGHEFHLSPFGLQAQQLLKV